MTVIKKFDRRTFLRGSATTGGVLVLGFFWPGYGQEKNSPRAVFGNQVRPAEKPALAAGETELNAWVRLDSDDTVTIVVPAAEMGQGVYTSYPMILADEMEADWDKVRVVAAEPDPVYRLFPFKPEEFGIFTAGSSSIMLGFPVLRQVGAAAREMLITAAANRWKVSPDECQAEASVVTHRPTGRSFRYGELVAEAAQLEPPAEPTLKSKDQFKLIGQPMKRLDTPAKITGEAVYGIDIQQPGMLIATVQTSPVHGGSLISYDKEAALALRGVVEVVEVPNGVAVVADTFWHAKQGIEVLKTEFDGQGNEIIDDAWIETDFRQALAETEAIVSLETGDVAAVLAEAEDIIEATYSVPFLAHATMEPMTCAALVTEDACEIWTGTQAIEFHQREAAKITGLPVAKVRVHNLQLGGGFGRRYEPDFVIQAVTIAQALPGRPIKLIWTREEDIQHGFYRPAAMARLRAALGPNGLPAAMEVRIVSPSVASHSPAFTNFIQPNGLDPTSVEGFLDLHYTVPNMRVEYVRRETHVPIGWWRSVGNSQGGFFKESFIDELAHAAGADPYEYRRKLMVEHPRHRAVLDRVADKAGWGQAAAGRYQGIALNHLFGGTIVGEVADISLDDGKLKLHRVTAVVDCGEVVNPDTVEAQIQGAIVYGLSALLRGEINIVEGRVAQSNFHDYQPLLMAEMPEIEVEILVSSEPPSGVGEPGLPPLAPAVVSALFAATGERIRSLPLSKHGLV